MLGRPPKKKKVPLLEWCLHKLCQVSWSFKMSWFQEVHILGFHCTCPTTLNTSYLIATQEGYYYANLLITPPQDSAMQISSSLHHKTLRNIQNPPRKLEKLRYLLISELVGARSLSCCTMKAVAHLTVSTTDWRKDVIPLPENLAQIYQSNMICISIAANQSFKKDTMSN